MTSPSPEPTTTNSIHTQRELATVEAFLLASNCLEFTKNAWLFLKKSLVELSITQNTRTTTTEDKIPKILSNIEKKISAPPALPQMPSTYADSACHALAHSTQEKPVPSRALNESTGKSC
jgi:hypothetical protein